MVGNELDSIWKSGEVEKCGCLGEEEEDDKVEKEIILEEEEEEARYM